MALQENEKSTLVQNKDPVSAPRKKFIIITVVSVGFALLVVASATAYFCLRSLSLCVFVGIIATSEILFSFQLDSHSRCLFTNKNERHNCVIWIAQNRLITHTHTHTHTHTRSAAVIHSRATALRPSAMRGPGGTGLLFDLHPHLHRHLIPLIY